MPIVPLSDQNVQQQPFDVPTPKFVTPIKEAYTPIADANVDAASAINKMVGGYADQKIQDHLWNEQARIYDSRERLANDITNILTDPGMSEVVGQDGKKTQVPNGILNRMSFAAQGSGAEYQAKIEPVKAAYLESFKIPKIRKQAERLFNEVAATGYRQAAQHEGTQIRKGTAQAFLSSAKNEVKVASLATSPEDLQGTVQNIKEAYLRYGAYEGLDPQTIDQGSNKLVGLAVYNAANNVLVKTGDIDQANKLVESFDLGEMKGVVGKHLKADYTNMKKIGEEKMKAANKETMTSLYKGVLTGEVNVNTVYDNIGTGIGNIDEKQAKFLLDAMAKPKNVKGNKVVFSKYLDQLYSPLIDSPEEADGIKKLIMADTNLSDDQKHRLIFGSKVNGASLAELSAGQIQDFGKDSGWWMFTHKLNRSDAVEAFKKFQDSVKPEDDKNVLMKKANKIIHEQAASKNLSLQDVGKDWTPMMDAYGNEVNVRRNDDDELEFEPVENDGDGADAEDNADQEQEMQ